jgi:GNAT superfamily N-acetyltransferase
MTVCAPPPCGNTVRAMALLDLPSLPTRPPAEAGAIVSVAGRDPFRIRPIRPSDLELERRFFDGLSARSRYLRLLSGRPLMPGELERWTNIDPCCDIALIAVVSTDGGDEEVGVAHCAVEDREQGRWDFAIVVADDWQRRGVGEALLRRLLQAAAAAGVATMTGLTLSENHGMVALARKLGFSVHLEDGDATLTRLELPLGG